jgi:hypothetical protein
MDYNAIRFTKDPAELEALAASEELWIVYEVVDNPYTPVNALVALSKHSDFRVASHAVKNPRFPADAAVALLASKADRYFKVAAAENPNLPESVLLKLAKETTDSVMLSSVLNNPSSTYEIIEAALSNKKIVADGQYTYIGVSVLAGAKTSSNEVLELIHRLLPDQAYHVAGNRNASPNLLDNLAREALRPGKENDGLEVARSVAKHKNVLPSTLALLASHADIWVRTKVAWNPSTEPSVLVDLSNDATPAVRTAVAKNRNTPEDTLQKLEHDSSSQVRNGAAVNRLKNTRP